MTNGKSEAERQFWKDVETLLAGDKFGHSRDVAEGGIGTYQSAIREHSDGEIPEVVYNQGEEKTAEIVHAVIEHGLPEHKPR